MRSFHSSFEEQDSKCSDWFRDVQRLPEMSRDLLRSCCQSSELNCTFVSASLHRQWRETLSHASPPKSLCRALGGFVAKARRPPTCAGRSAQQRLRCDAHLYVAPDVAPGARPHGRSASTHASARCARALMPAARKGQPSCPKSARNRRLSIGIVWADQGCQVGSESLGPSGSQWAGQNWWDGGPGQAAHLDLQGWQLAIGIHWCAVLGTTSSDPWSFLLKRASVGSLVTCASVYRGIHRRGRATLEKWPRRSPGPEAKLRQFRQGAKSGVGALFGGGQTPESCPCKGRSGCRE